MKNDITFVRMRSGDHLVIFCDSLKLKGAVLRGSRVRDLGEIYHLSSFFITLDLFKPPTLKPTRVLSILPGHHKDKFFKL